MNLILIYFCLPSLSILEYKLYLLDFREYFSLFKYFINDYSFNLVISFSSYLCLSVNCFSS